MKETWETLFNMSKKIPEKEFEVWLKEFMESLTILLENLLLVVDDGVQELLLQELQDITDAVENRDMIRLEDAIRYGLLDTTKKYCK